MNTMDTESANILKILEIPKETKYWLVRAGRGEEYEDFKQSSSIGIQYNQISLENLIQLEKISINVPELTPSGRKRKSETIEKEYNKKKMNYDSVEAFFEKIWGITINKEKESEQKG